MRVSALLRKLCFASTGGLDVSVVPNAGDVGVVIGNNGFGAGTLLGPTAVTSADSFVFIADLVRRLCSCAY